MSQPPPSFLIQEVIRSIIKGSIATVPSGCDPKAILHGLCGALEMASQMGDTPCVDRLHKSVEFVRREIKRRLPSGSCEVGHHNPKGDCPWCKAAEATGRKIIGRCPECGALPPVLRLGFDKREDRENADTWPWVRKSAA